MHGWNLIPDVDAPGQPLAVDGDGSTYLVGTTSSPQLLLDSTSILGPFSANASSTEAFVVKLQQNGTLAWVKALGDAWTNGEGKDQATAVVLDEAGSVYVGGMFEGPGFRADDLQVNYSGDDEPYIVKLDAISGKAQWLSQLGGTKVSVSEIVKPAVLLHRREALDPLGGGHDHGLQSSFLHLFDGPSLHSIVSYDLWFDNRAIVSSGWL